MRRLHQGLKENPLYKWKEGAQGFSIWATWISPTSRSLLEFYVFLRQSSSSWHFWPMPCGCFVQFYFSSHKTFGLDKERDLLALRRCRSVTVFWKCIAHVHIQFIYKTNPSTHFFPTVSQFSHCMWLSRCMSIPYSLHVAYLRVPIIEFQLF